MTLSRLKRIRHASNVRVWLALRAAPRLRDGGSPTAERQRERPPGVGRRARQRFRAKERASRSRRQPPVRCPHPAGRQITLWVDAVSRHVLLDGARIKTLPSGVVPRWVVANVMPQGAPPEDAAIDLDTLLGSLGFLDEHRR